MFGALLEFAVVNYVSRQDAHKADRKRKLGLGTSGKRKRKPWEIAQGDSGIDSDDMEDGFPRRLAAGNGNFPKAIKGNPKRRPVSMNFIKRWLSRFPTRSKKVISWSMEC